MNWLITTAIPLEDSRPTLLTIYVTQMEEDKKNDKMVVWLENESGDVVAFSEPTKLTPGPNPLIKITCKELLRAGRMYRVFASRPQVASVIIKNMWL